jgi:RNA polymerase sigma-70 factor (ECF subfamily)
MPFTPANDRIVTKRTPSEIESAHSLTDMTDPQATSDLLQRARLGDQEAAEMLFARYRPALRRWARGRLPQWARHLAETDDIVQDTLLRTFKRLDGFEHRGEGGFHAYLREVLVNRIREELRTAQRRPEMTELSDESIGFSGRPSGIPQGCTIEDYESALYRLDADDRELLIGRLEWGLTYKELAAALGKPSSEAARKAAERALVRLVAGMGPIPSE